MRTKAEIYLGADNRTHKINKTYFRLVLNVVSRYFDNATIERTIGIWKGKQEDSLKVVLFMKQAETPKIRELATALRDNLKQEAVLMETVNSRFAMV